MDLHGTKACVSDFSQGDSEGASLCGLFGSSL